MSKLTLFIPCFLFVLWGCKEKNAYYDMVIYNVEIEAIDTQYVADAIAISGGKIDKIGTWKSDFDDKIGPNTAIIDGKGAFLIPGFIEGHGHFSGLGYSMIELNFLQSKSWQQIISQVEQRVSEVQKGDWIVGRGWHQEKWDSVPLTNIYGYPYHHGLSAVSKDNPVILYHASGHSLFANQMAMDVVGITKETANPIGGEIVRSPDGTAIGVFEERAMTLFNKKYQAYKASLDQNKQDSIWLKAIDVAQDVCLKNGITSFQDAGSTFDELTKYENLAKEGKLKLRLWVMARQSAEMLKGKVAAYKKLNVGDHYYTCNAIKSEVDGALGAFGAWLLEDYSDKPGFRGQNTTDIYDVKKIADMAMEHDMQFCVHAIGDRANKVVLDIFEGVAQKHPKKQDLRWRIEHAQHVDPKDIPRFAKNKIIASMQGIHCTSDAPFVVKRLGVERARLGAYAWRSLLDNGVIIANGTDTPVEDVDPIKNFYASVTRKRLDSQIPFFEEQKMTRKEALYSYTLGNAYAAKEEAIKGSIRLGKLADFVILSNNLLNCSDDEILKTQVLYTIVNGKIMYKSI